MPFRSKAHRAFMFARHPTIARRWAKKYGGGGSNLPARITKKQKDDLRRGYKRSR